MMSGRPPSKISDNEDNDSDTDSSSSITSDSTSRTTPADAWFDVKSDTEQRQRTDEVERIGTDDSNGATRNGEPLLLKSKSTENLPDTPSSIGDSDGALSPTSSVSQAGQPWVNPYWGTDSKLKTNETHNEAAARSSPSFSSKQQLIPGSILIDDQGEIDGSTWKGRDTRLTSLASNNSFNPGSVYVSDESGGQGGFLAPTHTSASPAIPSSTLTAHSKDDLDLKQSAPKLDVSRQNSSTLSGRNDSTNDTTQEKKPWINPYWTTAVASNKDAGAEKKILSTSSTPTRALFEETSSRSHTASPLQSERKSPSGVDQTKSAWTNSYRDTTPDSKPPSTTLEPASTTVSTASWENPYWKDNNRKGVGALVDQKKVEDTSARQETKSPAASSSEQNAKSWENPYWKENKSQALSTSASGNKVEETAARQDAKSPVSSSSEQNARAWENPYWKENKSQALSALPSGNKVQEAAPRQDTKSPVASASESNARAWENPYWKENKSQTLSALPSGNRVQETAPRQDAKSPVSSSSEQNAKSWENPYWKENKSQALSTSASGNKVEETAPRQDTISPVASASESNAKSWENPYWKENKSQTLSALPSGNRVQETAPRQDAKSPVSSSSEQNARAWENPYWKENKSQALSALPSGNKVQETAPRQDTKSPVASASEQKAKPWENTYGNGNASPASSSSLKHERSASNSYVNVDALRTPVPPEKSVQQWENSYSKENKSVISTSSKQPEKPWENPYWKDRTAQGSETPKKSTDAVNKPQTFTIPTQPNTPWKNPYWKEQSSAGIESPSQPPSTPTGSNRKESKPQTPSITTDSAKPWTNPYWKDDARAKSSTPKVADQPGENPYWKQKSTTPSESSKKPQSTLSALQETTPWVNPYWKDNKSTSTEIKSNQRSQNQSTNGNSRQKSSPVSDSTRKRANGNALDNNLNYDNRSPSQHSVPSIPSYYERVYPPSGPTPSSKPSSKTNLSTKLSQQISSQPTTDDRPKTFDPISDNQDALPFTVDNRGVLHYQAQSPTSPVSSFKASNFVTSSPRSQSQAPLYQPSAQLIDGTSKATSYTAGKSAAPPTSTTANLASVDILNALTSASSYVVVTEREISDIQKALRLLETNPSSVPTVEASHFAPKTSSSSRTQNQPYATLNTTRTPPSNPANYSSISALVNTSSPNYSSTVSNTLDYPTKPK